MGLSSSGRTGPGEDEQVFFGESAQSLHDPLQWEPPRRGVAVGVALDQQVSPGADGNELVVLTGRDVRGGVVPIAAGGDVDGRLLPDLEHWHHLYVAAILGPALSRGAARQFAGDNVPRTPRRSAGICGSGRVSR
jgi:hypothetical protein